MDSWKGGRGLPPLRAWGSGPQREDKDLSLARLLCCCCVIMFLLGESYCSQPPDLCHPVRFQLASPAPRPLPSFLPQICCCCSCLIFSWVESINEPVSSLKQSIFWNVGRISDFAVWNVQGDAGTLVQESSFFFKMAFSHKVCLYTWNLWIILMYRDINLLKSFMVKNTRCCRKDNLLHDVPDRDHKDRKVEREKLPVMDVQREARFNGAWFVGFHSRRPRNSSCSRWVTLVHWFKKAPFSSKWLFLIKFAYIPEIYE